MNDLVPRNNDLYLKAVRDVLHQAQTLLQLLVAVELSLTRGES